MSLTDYDKNIERHTADTIVSLPNHKQWVIVHTSDLMMIIRQSIYILSIITREMSKLKKYSLTYCIMNNGENMLNLTHTLDKIYLRGILYDNMDVTIPSSTRWLQTLQDTDKSYSSSEYTALQPSNEPYVCYYVWAFTQTSQECQKQYDIVLPYIHLTCTGLYKLGTFLSVPFLL